MGAIDGLLRLMMVRNAEALVVAAGETPSLRRAGEPAPLSMPPLGDELMATFVSEVATGDARAALEDSGRVEVDYQIDTGEQFVAKLEGAGDKVRMTFRVAAAPPAPAPAVVVDAGARPVVAIAPPPPVTEAMPGGIDALLAQAEGRRASDIVVSANRPSRIKVDGRWLELSAAVFGDEDIGALVGDEVRARELEDTGATDFALDRRARGGLRYRVNLFRQARGLAAALRPIRTDVPTLEELGLPGSFRSFADYASGLVLMTGPAGSGKSTTLVALVEHVNRTRDSHVITIEDPIEYEYAPGLALVHQREVGRDVDSFASGLRAALREAPDIILLGEMRDLPTISAALTAAETGHLVLGTLHCGDAASAIDRVIDVYPAHQQRQVRSQLASSLRAVVTQVLLPARGGGRVPAYETMIVTPAIANQIREDKTHHIASQILTSGEAGMVPLERTLARLVRERRVDLADAKAACNDPERLEGLVRGR